MSSSKRHPLLRGVRITSLGTLTSRILGMVRDMATAALLGLSGSSAMDAFVIAYRIPNLFRRLFGEGALTASYLPVLSAELERDRQSAWRLASVMLTWLALLLAALVVFGEGLFALGAILWADSPRTQLLLGLSAVLLPYVLLICLAAQLATTLHALQHFTVPALIPVVMNVCWLAAAWFVAPYFAESRAAQAYVLAVAIVLAGVLQVLVQIPVLRSYGFRYHYDLAGSREALGRIGAAMAPMLIGLAATQINTFADSLIAWGLATTPDGPQQIAWLGGVRYPLDQGAAAATYYGERMYHFPLGVLGMAVATAIFPLLSRHAARGEHARLGTDLTLGLRLVIFLGVPASLGLIMLAEPMARLLFERGQFTADDTVRAARMIACYSAGVWAFCALPVLVRGFYALGDCGTPARVAGWMVGLNLTLNLSLIWPIAERGLAVATSVSAAVQVVVLTFIFSRRRSPLRWTSLTATIVRTLLATAAMAAAGYTALAWLPPGTGLTHKLVEVAVPLAVCMLVYAAVYRATRGPELSMLLGGVSEDE